MPKIHPTPSSLLNPIPSISADGLAFFFTKKIEARSEGILKLHPTIA